MAPRGTFFCSASSCQRASLTVMRSQADLKRVFARSRNAKWRRRRALSFLDRPSCVALSLVRLSFYLFSALFPDLRQLFVFFLSRKHQSAFITCAWSQEGDDPRRSTRFSRSGKKSKSSHRSIAFPDRRRQRPNALATLFFPRKKKP